ISTSGPLGVVIDQRSSLFFIYLETLTYGFFFVIIALHQRLTAYDIGVCLFGGIKDNVVGATTGWMDTTAADALNDFLLGDIELNDKIEFDVFFFEGIGLRDGPWKTVKQIAIFGVWLS